MQEPKRPTLLTKKDDKKEPTEPDKPRILLKPKEKPADPAAPPPISIALRPPSSNHSESNAASNEVPKPIAIKAKPATWAPATARDQQNAPPADGPPASMSRPIAIISDYYQIQNNVQDVLVDTNADFQVIGVIGAQHTGKSFVANLLIDDIAPEQCSRAARMTRLLSGRAEVFETGRRMADAQHQPCTEGIQMFVTRHRTIILDGSPVLCNPYKKDAIVNELDDLRMLIFLLSVCNQVVVVEDAAFNVHLLRLLRLAEQMRVDVSVEKGVTMARHSPNILFVKNRCGQRAFRHECVERTNRMYRMFFDDCDMRIYATPRGAKPDKVSAEEAKQRVNLVYLPFVEENRKWFFVRGGLFGVCDGHFWALWRILESFGTFRRNPGLFGGIWKMPGSFRGISESFRDLSGIFGDFPGFFGKILGFFEEFRRIWRYFVDFEAFFIFWEVPERLRLVGDFFFSKKLFSFAF